MCHPNVYRSLQCGGQGTCPVPKPVLSLHFLEIGGALQFETLDWEGWDDFGKTGLFWSGDGGGVII